MTHFHKAQVHILVAGERHAVEARVVGTRSAPGCWAVHRGYARPEWAVTHVASGASALHTSTAAEARAVALALPAVGAVLSKEDLRAIKTTLDTAREQFHADYAQAQARKRGAVFP